jgi:hypothetical protein
MPPPEIVPISRSKSDLNRFFDVADRVYKNDPNWVPPLRDDLAKVFIDKNPFFQHAEMQLFIARRNGADVGRIAAILDKAHNDFHNEKCAFFGYFESENDPAIAKALFDKATAWAKERGMTTLRGPANPSLNDEAGLLVDGFDSDPVLMMTYNPRYYVGLYEGAGFKKAKDLLAYWFDFKPDQFARLAKITRRIAKNEPNIVVRTVSKGELAKDLPKIREVYNEAWEKNWGFVPMTAGEMDYMAKRLKPLLVEELLHLGEIRHPDGTVEPIAFLLALPDYNVAMKPCRGRLLPFGWLKFLRATKKIKTVRVLTLGIKKDYRMRGIQAMIFETSLRACLAKGYKGCEVSWLLEDNDLITRSLKFWGGYLYKTYRMYDKAI